MNNKGEKELDFNTLAKDIIRLIGGEDNVKGLTHCATRIRFT